MAEYDQICDGDINWDQTKIISRENGYFKRCVCESLEIRKENKQPGSQHGLNRDIGKYVETNMWLQILNMLNIW